MPVTPLHLGFAWPVWLLNRKKLHFMSLSFGAMVPDLEVIPMMILNGGGERTRGLLHSLLGAVTFDILVVMFIVFFIIPPLGRWLKKNSKEKWHIFAGEDITLAPTNLGWALASALIGTLSHVLIDTFTHIYNPLLWPHNAWYDLNWMPFPDDFTSSMLFSIPMGIIALILALKYWTRPFKQ
ncbi:MAG: DUF4184 family protein [Candidatus Thermoplasmatota archaeon]|nr:DUF4184 family protein [Candidatus Thermoplasmatota archaeon]MBU4071182.1 DUF4184 family protein [Candidatus Thermoplasmatota archaeon]